MIRFSGPWTSKFYIFTFKDRFSLLFNHLKQGSEFRTPELVNLTFLNDNLLIFFFIHSKQGSESRIPGLVNLRLIFSTRDFTCFRSLKARVRISDPQIKSCSILKNLFQFQIKKNQGSEFRTHGFRIICFVLFFVCLLVCFCVCVCACVCVCVCVCACVIIIIIIIIFLRPTWFLFTQLINFWGQ